MKSLKLEEKGRKGLKTNSSIARVPISSKRELRDRENVDKEERGTSRNYPREGSSIVEATRV